MVDDGLFYGPGDSIDFGHVCPRTSPFSVKEMPFVLTGRRCEAKFQFANVECKVCAQCLIFFCMFIARARFIFSSFN